MAHKYLKPQKKSFMPVIIAIVLAVIAVAGLLLFLFGRDKKTDYNPVNTDPQQTQAMESAEPLTAEAAAMEGLSLLLPWEADGAKQPAEYTLVEYEGLTADQRKAFLDHMGAAGYAEWLEKAEAEAEKNMEIPWKNSGTKQPDDYTWAEYQALTKGQQKAFMEALGPYGLEAWLQKVQGGTDSRSGSSVQGGNTQSGSGTQSGNNTHSVGNSHSGNNNNVVKETYPWEESGSKKAENYTWEEYNALSMKHQKAFRDYLGKQGHIDWLNKVLYPWKTTGAKQPMDYTWEAYQALTKKQKEKFQEELGTDFAKWQENALANTPWMNPGAKQPENYMWVEYTSLTEAQQGAFQAHLGEESMKVWLKTITDIPWEAANAKQPDKYTMKEFEALKVQQQLAFRIYMGVEEFEQWRIDAQNTAEPNPWELTGAKQPKDYTWDEYNKLTFNQQMAFQNYLGAKEFENWMNKAESKPAANPWEQAGAKQPKDYTWAEFNALTAEQQLAFQKHLGAQGLAEWLNKVQEKPAEKPVVNPWDASGAKQPADYTWAEFNALTADQQMAFQNHLGSSFESWMNRVQEKPVTNNPWDASGAKQPADYTWAEFNALTGDQQMAFQNHLGSSGFESWMNRVQEEPEEEFEVNPWDVSGAKQPAEYTMEEFEALTGAQQMAFQNHLGPDAFEAWLNRVLEQPTEARVEEPETTSNEDLAAISAEELETDSTENP